MSNIYIRILPQTEKNVIDKNILKVTNQTTKEKDLETRLQKLC